MKRHGDRKAFFERRQKANLQWSCKVGDRDRATTAAATSSPDNAASPGEGDSGDLGTPATPIEAGTGRTNLIQQ